MPPESLFLMSWFSVNWFRWFRTMFLRIRNFIEICTWPLNFDNCHGLDSPIWMSIRTILNGSMCPALVRECLIGYKELTKWSSQTMLEISCSWSSFRDLAVPDDDVDVLGFRRDDDVVWSTSDGSQSIVVDSALCSVEPSCSICDHIKRNWFTFNCPSVANLWICLLNASQIHFFASPSNHCANANVFFSTSVYVQSHCF